jgi:hypothetical protein
MRIIKAILNGERDTKVLASLRDRRCKNGEEIIARSLQGNYRPEHLFSLKQAVELYEFYQSQIADCDRQILEQLNSFDAMNIDTPPPTSFWPSLTTNIQCRYDQNCRHRHKYGTQVHCQNRY